MDLSPMNYRNVLGQRETRTEVLRLIEQEEETRQKYLLLPDELKEELIAFCMGNRGLKITYDPFFKYMFNPNLHPGRLSEFLSLILKEEVEIVEVLPNESDRISDTASLLVMDILVRLKSGAYANVEIQKLGYLFQGQRSACYSSDLLMRQLSRERAKAKEQHKEFIYRSLQKVYTIVLMEKSPAAYWNFPEKYIHHSRQIFDTGLELDLLQEYFMISLDVFKEINHNKINKLEAWLYFIGSDSPKDICRVVEAYPEFKELYNEMRMLRYQTGELINMYDVYREALRAADRGTVKYMMEEQEKEIEKKKQEIEEQKQELEKNKQEISERDRLLFEKDEQLAELSRQLDEMKALLKTTKSK